jgi:hypothetical protein
MDAEIHAVDKEKRDSEGNILRVHGSRIEVAVKRYDGLPLGDQKDQQYLEVRASGWEGTTNSTLTARLNADDLQQLFEAAVEAEMITIPASQRVLGLLEQLREELSVKGPRRQKPK